MSESAGWYAQAFRRALFPLLDRLNRTRVSRVHRFLDRSQWLPRQRLQELQRDKLREMVAWTRQASVFYRRHWETAGEERRAASRYPELDGLPLVTKEELRAAAGEFPLPAYRGRVIRVQTSGSTGTPMTFLRSAEQESWFWALRIRMWEWAGWRLGEPYLAINLNPREAWKKRLQDRFFRCTYLTYDTDNQDSQRIVELLAARRIRHLNGFSSSLQALARHMLEHGVANPGVEVITATGDNLFPGVRQEIEQAFGVGVTDYYGAGGEGVHLASQCERRERYHVHMEGAVVEVVKDGRPARPGEVGTLVVTQLHNHAMPLVRYDLGDLATAGDYRPCPCGRPHETIEAINGRACDAIRAPVGRVLLPQFFFIGAFKRLERVYRYQVIQDRLDHLTVKLVAEEGCDRRRCERSLAGEITRASEGSLAIDFEWVPEIPLAGRGKPRAVVSELEATPFTAAGTPPAQEARPDAGS